jgi:hypothetical protein
MRGDNPIRHFVVTFAIALLLYVVAYGWIEHRRTRKRAWEVCFTNDAAGPVLVVNQTWLGISDVRLTFPEARGKSTNEAASFNFRDPRPVPYPVPFGRCVFMDTTFLPGTLTFELYGHEIELLPRMMILDHDEHAWHSGEVIELKSTNAGAMTREASGTR